MADETIPATAPVAAPAAPASTVDPIEYEKLKAQLAQLESHKTKMDRDAEKLRAEKAKDAERMSALRKLALGDDAAPDADPKALLAQRETEARAAKDAATALESSLSRALWKAGLVPRDGDLDYVLYKVNREPDLAESAKTGITADFLESLKSKGYVSTLSAPAPAAPVKPGGKAAAPAQAAVPVDPALAAIKTFQQFMALPTSRQNEIREKSPEFVAGLKSMHESRYRTAVR